MNLLVEAVVAVNRLFPRPRIYGRESQEAYAQWGYEVGSSVFEEHFGADVLKGARVLDVGCGMGGKTAWYAEAGAESVVGVDINESNVRHCRDFVAKRGVEDRVRTLCGDAMRMPFANGTFSLVTANDCMEHFADPAAALHELGRVLEPGGGLYLYFTPYLSPLGSHLYDYVKIPWCQILLPRKILYATLERCVHDAERTRGNRDGVERAAERYRAIVRYFEDDVNGITVRRFHQIVEAEPYVRKRAIHYVVLRFNFLRPITRIPLLREYFACLVFADLERI
jgi:ubiquinone/menaquinone biosynthesis C-methylase UbiE